MVFVDVIDQFGAKKRERIEIVVKPGDINEETVTNHLSRATQNIASDPLSSGSKSSKFFM